MARGFCYSQEFKAEAVQLILQGRTYRAAAEALGCSSFSIREWVRKHQLANGEVSDVPSSRERDEIRQLKRELAQVKQERDLLKKACAVFAQDSRNLQ